MKNILQKQKSKMITIVQVRKLDECIKEINFNLFSLKLRGYYIISSIQNRIEKASEMMEEVKEDFKNLRGLNFIIFNNIISLLYQLEYELNLIFNLNIKCVHQFIYSDLFCN